MRAVNSPGSTGFTRWSSKPAELAAHPIGFLSPPGLRDDPDVRAPRLPPDELAHLVAAELRQADVEQDDVGAEAFGGLAGLLAVVGGLDEVPALAEIQRQRSALSTLSSTTSTRRDGSSGAARPRHVLRRRRRRPSAAGARRTRCPDPGRRCGPSTTPPCSDTRPRTSASPRPRPPPPRSRPGTTCENFSNSRGSSPAAMPMPSSRTRISTWPSAAVAFSRM